MKKKKKLKCNYFNRKIEKQQRKAYRKEKKQDTICFSHTLKAKIIDYFCFYRIRMNLFLLKKIMEFRLQFIFH